MQLTYVISALNMLLSACKLPFIAEQDRRLEGKNSVDLISLVDDDIVTLRGEEDSFMRCRRGSMLLQNAFHDDDKYPTSNLDPELFQSSQAYQPALV